MSSFGALLRRLRVAGNLSQEALAEAARMSVAAISAYERGLRSAPHRESMTLLADALGLSGAARREFEAAGRRKSKPRLLSDQATSDRAIGNIPVETSSFVGREIELAQLVQHIRLERFVTVTGTGGIGKTRLAIRAATQCARDYRDGVWFVDFSAVSDDGDVIGKIAAVVGNVSPGTCDDLAAQLQGRQSLFVLDNCERLVEPIAAVIEAIVRRCPEMTVLATSRRRLRLSSELLYRVSTLPFPAAPVCSVAHAREFAAVKLFIARAANDEATLDLTDQSISVIATICRKLEGLPLAIELAAAHCSTLGLRRLQDDLEAHLANIPDSFRDLPPRQRTLEATIAWSLSLLDQRETAVFGRMSAFVGGCTIEAVATICSDLELDQRTISATIASLVDKSLINVVASAESPRYSMLDSTKHFILARLDAQQLNALARRHAAWCAVFAADNEYGLLEMRPDWWPGTIRPELDNIAKAVQWSNAADGDAVIAGRIIGSLRSTWASRHMSGEFLQLADRLLARIDQNAHADIVASLQLGRAAALYRQTDASIAAINAAISIRERLADERGLVACYLSASHVHAHASDFGSLEKAVGRAFDLAQKVGYRKLLPAILCYRTEALVARNDYREARLTALEASRLATRGVYDWFEIQFSLASVEYYLGNFPEAADIMEDVADIAEQQRYTVFTCRAGVEGATFSILAGQPERARWFGLITLENLGGRSIEDAVVAFQHIAAAEALMNRDVRAAARLTGYVEQWFLSSDSKPQLKTFDRIVEMTRTALGECLTGEELANCLLLGAMLSHEQAEKDCFAVTTVTT
jgi:predicted ATPase